MIILGGANKTGATNEVFRYDIHGNEFPLPKLTTPRYEFGCSGYYNNVGNLVSKKKHDFICQKQLWAVRL